MFVTMLRAVKYVCIDMSNAYSSWVEAVLPKAQIVYDHFHVIKAMIEKMDHVRRREMAESKRDCPRPVLSAQFLAAARSSPIRI